MLKKLVLLYNIGRSGEIFICIFVWFFLLGRFIEKNLVILRMIMFLSKNKLVIFFILIS